MSLTMMFEMIMTTSDDDDDIYIMMKCMYVTKKHHFLNVHQDEACLTVCYVLFSHSRVVYPQS